MVQQHSQKNFKSTLISQIFSLLFAIYNGFVGIYYKSIFNLSFSIYYVFLVIITTIILWHYIKNKTDNTKSLYIGTNITLLFLDLALFVPIILLIYFQKPVIMSLYIAIAYAAYTFYKIIIAIIDYAKKKKDNSILWAELKMIKLIDALLSVLSLENVLIIVVSKNSIAQSMKILSLVSGIVILIIVNVLTIINFVYGIKQLKMTSTIVEENNN